MGVSHTTWDSQHPEISEIDRLCKPLTPRVYQALYETYVLLPIVK